MTADQVALIWLCGYVSALAVFHCLMPSRSVVRMSENRPSVLPPDLGHGYDEIEEGA